MKTTHNMKTKIQLTRIAVASLLPAPLAALHAAPAIVKINYESFLSRHDMTWDRLPNRWELAPYSGNGNVGFLFYQAKGEAKNVISIYARSTHKPTLPSTGE